MSSPQFSSSSQVRCVTLVGHVDHGKSSYADSLLASNGIISQRMAGKIRYLDSRLDEQERGITMESSAVSLTFRIRTRDRDMKDKMVASGIKKDQEEVATPPLETAFTEQSYLLNLIDTPGHVDFSSEVSTASRLCDGCMLIVDAVEGVCTQTITVLRQAWSDRLTPILVINKIDRLILELKLSPTEAYHHLLNLIERVNAVVGEMWSAERMDEDYRNRNSNSNSSDSKSAELPELTDSDLYFDPPRGNVIFSSAIDGWAFRVHNFSNLYASKLGVSEPKFRSVLWGDYFFDVKSRRVLTLKERDREGKGGLKNMFTTFVLENIWKVYESTKVERDQAKIDKIISSLSLKIHPRDLMSKDPSILLQAIFAQWLPLSSTTFSTIVTQIPSPAVAQRTRMPSMLHPSLSYFATQTAKPENEMETDLYESKEGDQARRIGYVSKMFAVKRSDLPDERRAMELSGNGPRKPLTADEMRARAKEAKERKEKLKQALEATGVELGAERSIQLDEDGKVDKTVPSTAEGSEKTEEQVNSASQPTAEAEASIPTPALSSEVLLGFSRLYSGTLKVGDSVSVVLPKYDASLPPSHPHNKKHCKSIKIENLYMIMGRELINVKEVPAGNVCGIKGLEGVVGRNATLCAKPRSLETEKTGEDSATEEGDWYVNLAGKVNGAAPIVRVAIEPLNPSDMPKLIEGLRILNQADPCVETLVQETGEHVILTAGELHLERCLKDLRERFANCPLQTSAPLVPFRETAVKGLEMAPSKTEGASRGTIKSSISNNLVSYSIRAIPLPEEVTRFLLANSSTMRTLLSNRTADEKEAGAEAVENAVAAARVNSGEGEEDLASRTVRPEDFWKALETILEGAGGEWKDKKLLEKIWAFGPRRMGPNLLVDASGEMGAGLRKRTEARRQHQSGLPTPSTSDTNGLDATTLAAANLSLSADPASSKRQGFTISDLSESIDNGFQIAMQQGPMCAEPVQGMAYFVEKIEVDSDEAAKDGARGRLSQVTGSLISSVRETCRNGLLDWSPRLMLAMYSCDIQASTEVLGKVHGVLAKRRGKIISEEMQEGTAFFTVGSLLPVVESFGFADEIRTRTSGAASPQLIFKGFDLFDLDPFWVPTTQEELEDLGEKGERENVAKKYMDAVRRRKGMFVSERRIEAAEKQRTLKSN